MIIAWLLVVIAVGAFLLRRPERSAGLIAAYLLFYTASHWLAPAVQLLPWYAPIRSPRLTQLGFSTAFAGLLSFLIGALILAPWVRTWRVSRWRPTPESVSVEETSSRHPALIYYWLGIASYFVFIPAFGHIPTVGAVLGNMAKLLFVGAILLIHESSAGAIRLPRWIIMLPVLVWPVVTIVNEGFLGFGLVGATITLICLFQITGRHLKARHFLLAVLIGYLILSIMTTYFITRREIRNSVWGGDSLEERFSTIYEKLVEEFTLFDPGNSERLFFVEERLDLSYQVGATIEYIGSGAIDYAYGSTLADSVLMLIPRILWTDKHLQVGGHYLASTYTGIVYARGTSVGTGQVTEFYLNFGLPGVIIGLGCVGILVGALDMGAAHAILQRDYSRAPLYLLPGLGLLLIGDDMITVTGSAVSALITAILVNMAIRMISLRRSRPYFGPPPLQPARQRPAQDNKLQ